MTDWVALTAGLQATTDDLHRHVRAPDASHYVLVPEVVITATSVEDIAAILAVSRASGRPVTFRSGGTSLSGQSVTDAILVDARRGFRRITVEDDGLAVRLQPGATVRQANAHLARHGRKLGPDPASEIAATIGGVVANNSSGMACGIAQNTYRTLRSMVFVLPSGTVVDTSLADADDRLRALEPDLYAGLARLRQRVVGSPVLAAEVNRQYGMKNTMGYGLNSLLDFEAPVDILSHLVVGSEGTLAFVAEVTLATVEVLPHAATGLLVFPTLGDATASLPALVAAGPATIELLDAPSLRVGQRQAGAPDGLRRLAVREQAALLVEFQTRTADDLAEVAARSGGLLSGLPLDAPAELTTDAALRAGMWHVRKGLYTTVAGARPSGTTALLEDVAVPVPRLERTCATLTALFDAHGYEGSVIFGHAKDGNIHFMLNERFDDPVRLARYRAFTEDMVDLVLSEGGTLKAEHGTGRIMAPFVRRQFGDALYDVMREIKRLCDPERLLSPGILVSDDPDAHVRHLKTNPTVESEVDRCVECGFCESSCPSRDLTLTPRQRIAGRRAMRTAEQSGDPALAGRLRDAYDYEGLQTCAVDGLCAEACPLDIDTGSLVTRLRAQGEGTLEARAWTAAARAWGPFTRTASVALTAARALPATVPVTVTRSARRVLGTDVVPEYGADLPGGGRPRPRRRGPAAPNADVVLFAACIGSMFGPVEGSAGAATAFARLCRRARLVFTLPPSMASLCCGTPWKSKGHPTGYAAMTEHVLPELWDLTRGGRVPVVSDAASCTEGLRTMAARAAERDDRYAGLVFVDATQFAHERMLDRLTVSAPVASIAVHRTCSTTALGADDALVALARFVSDDVCLPIDWGCCAFAGDRGLLHPELTASATAAEAAELAGRVFAAHVSANRTCELGMSRATGARYRHILEVVEEATRPAPSGPPDPAPGRT
jgi:D-lactate dehydrogenase